MGESLTLLKLRLLLRALDRVPDAGSHALVIREAALSERICANWGFPELLFPALFEERVRLALEEDAHQRQRYWETVRA
jgi:hypothetical protein